MDLNLVDFLTEMKDAQCPLSAADGLLTTESGDVLDVAAALAGIRTVAELEDALRKAEAVLTQLQESPQQAVEIVGQGRFGYALMHARSVLAAVSPSAAGMERPG